MHGSFHFSFGDAQTVFGKHTLQLLPVPHLGVNGHAVDVRMHLDVLRVVPRYDFCNKVSITEVSTKKQEYNKHKCIRESQHMQCW